MSYIKDRWYIANIGEASFYLIRYERAVNNGIQKVEANAYKIKSYDLEQGRHLFHGIVREATKQDFIDYGIPELWEEQQFIEGKWYTDRIGANYFRKCNGRIDKAMSYSERIDSSLGWEARSGSTTWSNYIEVTLDKIQQWLPEGHIDKWPKKVKAYDELISFPQEGKCRDLGQKIISYLDSTGRTPNEGSKNSAECVAWNSTRYWFVQNFDRSEKKEYKHSTLEQFMTPGAFRVPIEETNSSFPPEGKMKVTPEQSRILQEKLGFLGYTWGHMKTFEFRNKCRAIIWKKDKMAISVLEVPNDLQEALKFYKEKEYQFNELFNNQTKTNNNDVFTKAFDSNERITGTATTQRSSRRCQFTSSSRLTSEPTQIKKVRKQFESCTSSNSLLTSKSDRA